MEHKRVYFLKPDAKVSTIIIELPDLDFYLGMGAKLAYSEAAESAPAEPQKTEPIKNSSGQQTGKAKKGK